MSRKFELAMVTKDFMYYLDESEGDDNGSVHMYRRDNQKLVSDNYRANQDMLENILYYNYEWLCDTLKYTRKCLVEEHKIKLAQEFFHENRFPGKIANITYDGVHGAFNKALKLNLGFTLDKSELEIVHKAIKAKTKKIGKHM